MTTTSTKATHAVDLFGVPVDALTMEQTLDRVHDAVARRRPLHIGVVNAAKIVNMWRNPALGEDVLRSDIILADGMSVVWASRLMGTPLPERIAGIDLMECILRLGQRHGYRVFCLGATEDVSGRVAERLDREYAGVVLAGRRHGYFSAAEEAEIAQQIRNSHADVLLVAITSPGKEQFMARWNDVMQVPVVHGVGGSFDVMAGKVERAPRRWQVLGLEWLYRLKQEPRRLWRRYLVTNSLFAWLLLKALYKKHFGHSQGGPTRRKGG